MKPRSGLVRCGLLLLALPLAGCSVRELAASKVGDSLAAGGAGWGVEDDPELVREALPFALKLMESLAVEAPKHRGLRLGLCRGFASYAGGFLEADAERIEMSDFEAARKIRDRARRLHLRGRDYCLAALDLLRAGSGARLLAGETAHLGELGREHVELLYWSGVAWGSAVAMGLDRPEMVADLPVVRGLFERALELDERFDRGSVHEAMIVFDSMPAMMGGSYERARRHYDRAVELSDGERASPHVTWARSSAISRQARTEFIATLDRALAIDPSAEPADRLMNLISQERARQMLARTDDFFFADEPVEESE